MHQIWYWVSQGRPWKRGSMITGRSVHNTRIEGMWRHIGRGPGADFIGLFGEMADDGIFILYDPVHMFVLHMVMMSRIQSKFVKRLSISFPSPFHPHPPPSLNNWSFAPMLLRAGCLDAFVAMWDDHKIRGPNSSPNEMWVGGDEVCEAADDQQYAAAPELYGAEPDLQLPADPAENEPPTQAGPPEPDARDPLYMPEKPEVGAFLQRVRGAFMEEAGRIPADGLPEGFRGDKSAAACKLEFLCFLHVTLELVKLADATPAGHPVYPQDEWVHADPGCSFCSDYQVRYRIVNAAFTVTHPNGESPPYTF